MSPRTYRMQRRRESADETRQRILAAARELLTSAPERVRFSLEEVARRAGVARMTVYYQFGSLRGLLEALLDSLASAGGIHHLADAFRQADPRAAVDHFIAVFIGFWESDRLVLRGLGALTTLNPELAAVVEERSGWRRQGARILVERLMKQIGRLHRKDMEEAEDVLFLLTSFATYDTLAGVRRSKEEVTALIQRIARETLA